MAVLVGSPSSHRVARATLDLGNLARAKAAAFLNVALLLGQWTNRYLGHANIDFWMLYLTERTVSGTSEGFVENAASLLAHLQNQRGEEGGWNIRPR
jgi:hypothetical protein